MTKAALRADMDWTINDAIAAQLGVCPYGPKTKGKRKSRVPPISSERARQALDGQAEWALKNRVADRPFGSGGPIRDVGAELTDSERESLWRFFDGDPRRLTITWMVEVCARGDPGDWRSARSPRRSSAGRMPSPRSSGEAASA